MSAELVLGIAIGIVIGVLYERLMRAAAHEWARDEWQ